MQAPLRSVADGDETDTARGGPTHPTLIRLPAMSALQIAAIIIGVGITIVGWGLLARAVNHFVTLFKLGQSTPR